MEVSIHYIRVRDGIAELVWGHNSLVLKEEEVLVLVQKWEQKGILIKERNGVVYIAPKL
jgi:hypothetical protein